MCESLNIIKDQMWTDIYYTSGNLEALSNLLVLIPVRKGLLSLVRVF